MRWPWENSTQLSCFRIISENSWSVRRSIMATGPRRRMPQGQRSRWDHSIIPNVHLQNERNNFRPKILVTSFLDWHKFFSYFATNVLFFSTPHPSCFVFPGWSEVHRGGASSRDAQDHFWWPADWGSRWRLEWGKNLPGEEQLFEVRHNEAVHILFDFTYYYILF